MPARYACRLIAAPIAGAVVYAAASASAGMPVEETLICPIGGESFTNMTTTTCSYYGRRFDLYAGSTCPWVKWPPICPGNGFPMFEDAFTDAEKEELSAIVESDDFQAARRSHPPRYMHYFVQQALGASDGDLWAALLPAVWDAHDAEPGSEAVYLKPLLTHLENDLPTLDPGDDPWWTAQLLAANTERRLGAFDAAAARLDHVADAAPDGVPDDYHWPISALQDLIASKDGEPAWIPRPPKPTDAR